MRLSTANAFLLVVVKDAFHRHIVDGEAGAINPHCRGTKSAAWYAFDEGDGVPPGECAVVRFRLSKKHQGYLDEELFDDVIEQRRAEADDFFWRISPLPMADDLRNIQRQALSGMMWCKQYYQFVWDQVGTSLNPCFAIVASLDIHQGFGAPPLNATSAWERRELNWFTDTGSL